MQVTSTKTNFNAKQGSPFKPSRFLNNSKGFILAELITAIVIIGILAAVGIQQYSQYKMRAYDAHSKQALHDMNLTCKAFWIENDASEECDLTKSKEYGFVQNPEVAANVLSTLPENFSASANIIKALTLTAPIMLVLSVLIWIAGLDQLMKKPHKMMAGRIRAMVKQNMKKRILAQ